MHDTINASKTVLSPLWARDMVFTTLCVSPCPRTNSLLASEHTMVKNTYVSNRCSALHGPVGCTCSLHWSTRATAASHLADAGNWNPMFAAPQRPRFNGLRQSSIGQTPQPPSFDLSSSSFLNLSPRFAFGIQHRQHVLLV